MRVERMGNAVKLPAAELSGGQAMRALRFRGNSLLVISGVLSAIATSTQVLAQDSDTIEEIVVFGRDTDLVGEALSASVGYVGGPPQAMKREIFRRYPIEERRALVERLLDRGLAETGSSGAPNRQKQPGQCCATGCQPPAGQDS